MVCGWPLLASCGAELILHGHAHRAVQNYLKTPSGDVPVVGAPSASSMGRNLQRRARYYIYNISPNDNGWDTRLTVRIYSPEVDRFILEREEKFIMSH